MDHILIDSIQEIHDMEVVISSVNCEDSPGLRSPATKRPKLNGTYRQLR